MSNPSSKDVGNQIMKSMSNLQEPTIIMILTVLIFMIILNVILIYTKYIQ